MVHTSMHNEKAFPARLRLGVVCLTALMTIVVGANSYVVGMSNKSAACIQHHVAKRHAGESDALMQERVNSDFDQMTNEAVSTPIARPASPSNSGPGPSSGSKRPTDKLSPSSTASLMPPPPPKLPRKQTRGSMQLEAATGKPIDELLFGERQAASSSADSRPKDPHVLRRLEKKVREIERLQQQASDGRELSAEERTKVGELLVFQRQIALLKQPTPGSTPVQTPGSTQTPSSELSGASTQIHAAACFASARTPPRGQGAVATYLAADARTNAPHFGRSAAAAGGRAKRARVRSRGGSTGGTRGRAGNVAAAACALGQLGRPGTLQALWQLAMCEFALEHIADVASSPKQLQLEFRAACEEVRHPDEVPRLRCLASSMTPTLRAAAR